MYKPKQQQQNVIYGLWMMADGKILHVFLYANGDKSVSVLSLKPKQNKKRRIAIGGLSPLI